MEVRRKEIGTSELVVAARAGDRDAFAELVDRHRMLLLTLCRRTLRDPLLAEDAAHEAIVQAMLGLDRLRRPEQFGPWLCGIGLNMCRRWLRDRTARAWSWEALFGGRLASEPEDRRPSPHDLVEAAELSARVRGAVAALPPGQRSAVLLFYLAGLTCQETAETLGIEVGAVKGRLHKARKTLRKTLWSAYAEDAMTESAVEPVETRVKYVLREPGEGEDGSDRHLVVLEEVDGKRPLPIWVGRAEAEAIAVYLENLETPRPMTMQFAVALVQALGGQIQDVTVSRLVEEVFYATVRVVAPDGTREVDARPSDAIALAVATGVPIRVERSILDRLEAAHLEQQRTRQPTEPSSRVRRLRARMARTGPTFETEDLPVG